MSRFNWINGEDFSIQNFYLMDRWLLSMIYKKYEDQTVDDLSDHAKTMGTLLKKHEDLVYVISKRAPEAMKGVNVLLSGALVLDDKTLRAREILLMEALETDVVYTDPVLMDKHCNYITAWDDKYLFELADFKNKVVLDLGAGTGRLTFAATPYAKRIYASEPVDMLREYMRDQMVKKGLNNIKVQDGIILDIPHEDNTFDIVMSGHVVGDFYDEEIAEMERVIKPGGMIVICNGDDDLKRKGPEEELIKRGFKAIYHKSSIGGDIYNYQKVIKK